VDGKALRGTAGLHLFSAFGVERECVVAQIAIPEKTNEIPMLSELLREVPLEDKLVTADALHTQSDTARHLVQERGADYLLTVKNNQPTLRAACERLLPEPSFSP
jgi:predicted transposase YbfD/YdcC